MKPSVIVVWSWCLLLTALWMATLAGFFPEGVGINWLVSAEVWLTNNTSDPIFFALLTGLMVSSWAVPLHRRVGRSRLEKSEARRLLLGQLRTEGVGIRNEVIDPQSASFGYSEWADWEQRSAEWSGRAIESLRIFSQADAEWFRTLDVVGPPRIPMPLASEEGNIQRERYHTYAMHDCRLARLDQLIQKYWKK